MAPESFLTFPKSSFVASLVFQTLEEKTPANALPEALATLHHNLYYFQVFQNCTPFKVTPTKDAQLKTRCSYMYHKNTPKNIQKESFLFQIT